MNADRVARSRVIAWWALWWLIATAISSEVWAAVGPDDYDFPFQAHVLRDQAPVYSGPGAEHYTTILLPRGTTVEVIRFDPGGWVAIGPTAEEFSLIPASAVESIDEYTAEVIVEDSQVWVGTRTGAVDQPMWQVKLRQGDLVEVLGQIDWPNPQGDPTTWLQIAPPSGEFRWIHRDQLQLPDRRTQLPEPAQPLDDAAARPLPRRTIDSPWPDSEPLSQRRDDSPRRAFVDSLPTATPNTEWDLRDEPERMAAVELNSGWRRASAPIRLARQEESAPTVDTGPVAWNQDRFRPTNPAVYAARPQPSSTPWDQIPQPVRPTVDEPLSSRLQQLDVQVALEIVKPIEHWNLSPLFQSLQEIQTSAASPQEQRQSVALRAKLDRLRESQERMLGATRLAVPVPMAGAQPIGSGVGDTEPRDLTYDAVGWLNELVQNHGAGQTTYVLQDDQGKITHHLTPAPGLNLHRYLKTKIGVKGARGFHQRFNLEHVTADRVVVLEKSPTLNR